MHARFYAPHLEGGDLSVTLPIDEGRHLIRVLRLRVGSAVRVFNGRGTEYEGHVESIDCDDVVVAVERRAIPARESRTRITLAQSLLKGDCMDGVIRDAVMLGVAAIVPVLSSHVEGERRGHAASLRLPRWERIAVASAKQCGRATVPPILPPSSLAACLSIAVNSDGGTFSTDATGAEVRVALVEPASLLPIRPLRELGAGPPPAAATLFIGPEGGWAEEELRLFAGYEARAVTLGPRTLRAETAAIVGLSVLHTLWGEFA